MLSDIPDTVIDSTPGHIIPTFDDQSDGLVPGAPKRTINISLDIETLSTHKNAVVLSVAAVRFSGAGVFTNGFSIKLGAQEQIDQGRHVSEATLQFWAAQDPAIFQKSLGGDASVGNFFHDFDFWITGLVDLYRGDAIQVWTKGPAFDAAIIESLAEGFGQKCPVTYREWLDVRTIEKLAKYRPPAFDGAHDPLIDAIEQAKSIIECHRILGVDL